MKNKLENRNVFFYQLITFLIILISPFIIIFRIFKKKSIYLGLRKNFGSFQKKEVREN